QRNDTGGLVLGHNACGYSMMFLGSFILSRSHLDAVLAFHDTASHRALVPQAGIHPQGASQSLLGIVLFCLGFPDRAMVRSRAALAEARRLAHPPSLAVSLSIGSRLLSLGAENATLDEYAGELVAVATDLGFPVWRAQGTM